MKKSRRVPRKIGGDDDGDAAITPETSGMQDSLCSQNLVSNAVHKHRWIANPTSQSPDSSPLPTAVKRPTIGSRTATKLKSSSSLRNSLAFDDLDTSAPDLPLRKPTSLAKRALDRTSNLPLRAGQADDRPSYDTNYLNELKNSTPTTPANLSATEDDNIPKKASLALDIASKFGADTVITTYDDDSTTHIPSAAEIQEKKERRRRLAKEHDYISLNDDNKAAIEDAPLSDDEFAPRHTLIIPADELKPSKYETDTRLVRDDENMYEDFEQFTEDSGKVALSRRGIREQEKLRRKELAVQIKAAQHGYGYGAGVSDDDDDEDENGDEVDQEEVARIAAYDAAQTRAGTYSTGSSLQRERAREERARRRFEVQPKIRQIPELKAVVGRFWEMVRAKEAEVEASKRRLEKVARERVEMGLEEVRIKALLKEAGERYEKLRQENAAPSMTPVIEQHLPPENSMARGLEGLAELTPSQVTTPANGSEDLDVEDDVVEAVEHEAADAPAPAGLGFPMGVRSGFGGMSAPRAAEDDW